MLSRANNEDQARYPQKGLRGHLSQLKKKGFTLLEVLIALAVLSIAMLSLHQAFASNIYMTIYTRDLWKAVIFTRNELMQVERGSPPTVGVTEGTYEDDHELANYKWNRKVEDVEPFPGIKVRKVTFELSWEDGVVPRNYRSEVYVLPK